MSDPLQCPWQESLNVNAGYAQMGLIVGCCIFEHSHIHTLSIYHPYANKSICTFPECIRYTRLVVYHQWAHIVRTIPIWPGRCWTTLLVICQQCPILEMLRLIWMPGSIDCKVHMHRCKIQHTTMGHMHRFFLWTDVTDSVYSSKGRLWSQILIEKQSQSEKLTNVTNVSTPTTPCCDSVPTSVKIQWLVYGICVNLWSCPFWQHNIKVIEILQALSTLSKKSSRGCVAAFMAVWLDV